MGYMHINNLYKDITIMQFKECYALEKIHGTSAHITWKDNKVTFFSGGEKHEKFIKLFDEEKLTQIFKEKFYCDVTVYGEAYGGKQQGMSETYGKELKFIVFDVMINDNWLDVPDAEDVAKKLGLEFVHYVKIKTDLEFIDEQRDAPSVQAKRNGITEDKLREGIVLRPLTEMKLKNGNRVITKHKRDEFKETKTKREVDPEKITMLKEAQEIADEWVTPMRMNHILDKLGNPTEVEKTKKVISAMIEDVLREASGEILESNAAKSMIGKAAAKMYHDRISKINKPK